ncbi:hypothetical protein [Nocardioides aquiterrae]|uniref:Uncharacterized protein n=1 Tax=Nocardioides aquiterrae TaxID=203799 RepID=A0ABP4EYT7_9ACTN
MSRIWKPWEWAVASHTAALDNARTAATELSRLRVEREDVELFLANRSDGERREGAG